jgi:hypothetical protein
MTGAASDLSNIVAPVVAGQSYDIMPIPMMAKNAEWFDAGPVSFAVEARLLGESKDDMSGGGGSIHVFSGDRAIRRNVVWGFDEGSNGPMPQWALAAIRDNLPGLLRSAGADELATRVEREGFDRSVLAKVAEAVNSAHRRTLTDKHMLGEGQEWIAAWRAEELAGRE